VLELRRAKYGLDRPPVERYFRQLGGYCRGDFGLSYRLEDRRVADILAEALPPSLAVGGTALLLATFLGCAIGVLAAVRQNSVYDHLTLLIALAGISLPTFVTGAGLSICFCLLIRWFPAAGWGTPAHVVLPAITLALPLLAYVARLQRAGMLDVLGSDYIRTAAAKGAGPTRVVLRHALRNAMMPVISYIGPAAAFALTGSFVVEKVFNVPGLGRDFIDSVLHRDYTLILGTVFVFSAFLVTFNLLVDVVYGLVDPRIRHARQ
jgi:oligopeptide transport system permease protein